MGSDINREKRIASMIIGYPIIVLLISLVLNHWVLGVNSLVIALPSIEVFCAFAIMAILLVFNHTWILSATEITRNRYKIFATPEEWHTNGVTPEESSKLGRQEIERHHNTHRNSTENSVVFIAIALAFVLSSPPAMSAQIWLIGFGVARLGHTCGYLAGKDSIRGVSMTLSLLATYGLSGYLVLCIFT